MSAGSPEDAPEVANLYQLETARHSDIDRITKNMSRFPSVVARDPGGRMIGFVFSVDFAPDILELANIFVLEEHRSSGIGAKLVAELEAAASMAGFRWMILVNSVLNPSASDKRPATTFYEKLGYTVMLDTGPSKVFTKPL